MKITLNITDDKKDICINESTNFGELYDKLTKMFPETWKDFTIVSLISKEYVSYPVYPVYPWNINSPWYQQHWYVGDAPTIGLSTVTNTDSNHITLLQGTYTIEA